jgi:hypothetical protein
MLGLLALFIGALRYQLTEETVRLWWYADRYVPAELEVKHLEPIRRSRTTVGHRIEGVIHPGGEAVVADSRLMSAPPAEKEGQRLAVWYWPNHAEVKRSWHPPTVVSPGATRRGDAVARIVLSWVVIGGFVAFCFWRVVRGYRSYRLTVPPEPEGQAPSAWVGITLVLLYLGVLGSVAYLMSR